MNCDGDSDGSDSDGSDSGDGDSDDGDGDGGGDGDSDFGDSDGGDTPVYMYQTHTFKMSSRSSLDFFNLSNMFSTLVVTTNT